MAITLADASCRSLTLTNSATLDADRPLLVLSDLDIESSASLLSSSTVTVQGATRCPSPQATVVIAALEAFGDISIRPVPVITKLILTSSSQTTPAFRQVTLPPTFAPATELIFRNAVGLSVRTALEPHVLRFRAVSFEAPTSLHLQDRLILLPATSTSVSPATIAGDPVVVGAASAAVPGATPQLLLGNGIDPSFIAVSANTWSVSTPAAATPRPFLLVSAFTSLRVDAAITTGATFTFSIDTVIDGTVGSSTANAVLAFAGSLTCAGTLTTILPSAAIELVRVPSTAVTFKFLSPCKPPVLRFASSGSPFTIDTPSTLRAGTLVLPNELDLTNAGNFTLTADKFTPGSSSPLLGGSGTLVFDAHNSSTAAFTDSMVLKRVSHPSTATTVMIGSSSAAAFNLGIDRTLTSNHPLVVRGTLAGSGRLETTSALTVAAGGVVGCTRLATRADVANSGRIEATNVDFLGIGNPRSITGLDTVDRVGPLTVSFQDPTFLGNTTLRLRKLELSASDSVHIAASNTLTLLGTIDLRGGKLVINGGGWLVLGGGGIPGTDITPDPTHAVNPTTVSTIISTTFQGDQPSSRLVITPGTAVGVATRDFRASMPVDNYGIIGGSTDGRFHALDTFTNMPTANVAPRIISIARSLLNLGNWSDSTLTIIEGSGPRTIELGSAALDELRLSQTPHFTAPLTVLRARRFSGVSNDMVVEQGAVLHFSAALTTKSRLEGAFEFSENAGTLTTGRVEFVDGQFEPIGTVKLLVSGPDSNIHINASATFLSSSSTRAFEFLGTGTITNHGALTGVAAGQYLIACNFLNLGTISATPAMVLDTGTNNNNVRQVSFGASPVALTIISWISAVNETFVVTQLHAGAGQNWRFFDGVTVTIRAPPPGSGLLQQVLLGGASPFRFFADDAASRLCLGCGSLPATPEAFQVAASTVRFVSIVAARITALEVAPNAAVVFTNSNAAINAFSVHVDNFGSFLGPGSLTQGSAPFVNHPSGKVTNPLLRIIIKSSLYQHGLWEPQLTTVASSSPSSFSGTIGGSSASITANIAPGTSTLSVDVDTITSCSISGSGVVGRLTAANWGDSAPSASPGVVIVLQGRPPSAGAGRVLRFSQQSTALSGAFTVAAGTALQSASAVGQLVVGPSGCLDHAASPWTANDTISLVNENIDPPVTLQPNNLTALQPVLTGFCSCTSTDSFCFSGAVCANTAVHNGCNCSTATSFPQPSGHFCHIAAPPPPPPLTCFCPAENEGVAWPVTACGASSTVACPDSVLSGTKANRTCLANQTWAAPTFAGCRRDALEALAVSDINTSNFEDKSKQLRKLTRNAKALGVADVRHSAVALERIASAATSSLSAIGPKPALAYVTAVSHLLIPPADVSDAGLNDTTGRQIAVQAVLHITGAAVGTGFISDTLDLTSLKTAVAAHLSAAGLLPPTVTVRVEFAIVDDGGQGGSRSGGLPGQPTEVHVTAICSAATVSAARAALTSGLRPALSGQLSTVNQQLLALDSTTYPAGSTLELVGDLTQAVLPVADAIESFARAFAARLAPVQGSAHFVSSLFSASAFRPSCSESDIAFSGAEFSLGSTVCSAALGCVTNDAGTEDDDKLSAVEQAAVDARRAQTVVRFQLEPRSASSPCLFPDRAVAVTFYPIHKLFQTSTARAARAVASSGTASISTVPGVLAGETLLSSTSLLSSLLTDAPVVAVLDSKLESGTELSQGFLFTLPRLFSDQASAVSARECVYFDYSPERRGVPVWSADGCEVVHALSNSTHTTCNCSHTTHFSVLTNTQSTSALSATDELVLSIVTYIGMAVSIPALLLFLLTFACLKALRTLPKRVMMHLAANLLVALVVFTAGIAGGGGRDSDGGCKAVAVLLHYFLLVAFAWMLVDGYLLYRSVVKVLETHISEDPMLRFCFFAYGVPAVIVGVSLGAAYSQYGDGSSDTCWLSTDSLIWAFVGPVLLVLALNAWFFSKVVTVLRQAHARDAGGKPNRRWLGGGETDTDGDDGVEPSSSASGSERLSGTDPAARRRQTKWLRLSVMTVTLLGLTWIFGPLALEDASVTMQYIFTVFNVLQGLAIYVFNCLLDDNVRAAYRRGFQRVCGCCSSDGAAGSAGASRRGGPGQVHPGFGKGGAAGKSARQGPPVSSASANHSGQSRKQGWPAAQNAANSTSALIPAEDGLEYVSGTEGSGQGGGDGQRKATAVTFLEGSGESQPPPPGSVSYEDDDEVRTRLPRNTSAYIDIDDRDELARDHGLQLMTIREELQGEGGEGEEASPEVAAEVAAEVVAEAVLAADHFGFEVEDE